MIRGKPYCYGEHLLPHDAEARELGTGKSRLEVLQSLLEPMHGRCRAVPRLEVEDGINPMRMLIPRSWFDGTKTARGIEALRTYRAEYDEQKKVLSRTPVHDWASHAADAARTFAVGFRDRPKTGQIVYPKLGSIA